jgi:hypothetical protein
MLPEEPQNRISTPTLTIGDGALLFLHVSRNTLKPQLYRINEVATGNRFKAVAVGDSTSIITGVLKSGGIEGIRGDVDPLAVRYALGVGGKVDKAVLEPHRANGEEAVLHLYQVGDTYIPPKGKPVRIKSIYDYGLIALDDGNLVMDEELREDVEHDINLDTIVPQEILMPRLAKSM